MADNALFIEVSRKFYMKKAEYGHDLQISAAALFVL